MWSNQQLQCYCSILVSGEAEFVWDLPKQGGELYAAFVITKHGPATLESIDATAALVRNSQNSAFKEKTDSDTTWN